MPLFWRIFLANAAALLACLLLLAVTPFTLSSPPTTDQLGWLTLGFLALLLVNAAVLGDRLTPLARLRRALDGVGGLGEGRRIPVGGRDEVAQVATAYNKMLDRLADERTDSVRAVLRAQEDERGRIARELHDEIGQTMTFLLLRVTSLAQRAPAEVRADLDAIAEGVRGGLEEVRTMSRRLRPSALADLGIGPALQSMAQDVRQVAQLAAEVRVARGLDRDLERDLVVYRVAQEAITNVVRHAEASRVDLELELDGDWLVLTVADDGSGTTGPEGTGSNSMRERARLVGGRFERSSMPGVGTRCVLRVPRQVTPPSGDREPRTGLFPTTTIFPPPAWMQDGGRTAQPATGAPGTTPRRSADG